MAGLLPAPDTVLPDVNDKLAHGAGFMILTLWFAGIYPERLVRVALWLAAFGAALELAQGLTATRSLELMDLAADLVGIAIGLGLAALGLAGWCGRVEQMLAPAAAGRHD